MAAPDDERLVAARTLRIDASSAKVVSALTAAGVETILLKGPGIVRWFYGDAARSYVDCDLLVDPGDRSRAVDVLSAAGYREITPPDRSLVHATAWIHADEPAEIDLHTSMQGAGVSPVDAWGVLRAHAVTVDLVGTPVRILDRVATTVNIALHAAHHGVANQKPLEDLRRVVDQLSDQEWRAAAALAARLRASPAFAAGLRLLPEGKRIAEELRLPAETPVAVALALAAAPPGAFAMAQLVGVRGLRAKAALAARRLVPPAIWMRAFHPLARRGRLGLAAAYALRPLLLLLRAGPELAAWVRVRRDHATR
ncbi:MAG: nucleotidyltransferase family protein [Thermoleophilia bacterium]|nr:nucleotidyltransferase family protein [Thermoleophilia bacterium]